MISFLQQLSYFILGNIAFKTLKYSFLIVNIFPLLIYYFYGISSESLITYFILETLAYCTINILFVKLVNTSLGFIKFVMLLTSLSLISLAVYFIPEWNKSQINLEQMTFWNYAAILFSFYTFNLISDKNDFYSWSEDTLKRNVILKFSILAFITIAGSILAKYIKSEILFLSLILCVKTISDFLALKKVT